MSKSIPIRYQTIWANIYIVVGITCSLIFVMGSLLLGEIKTILYIFASIVPIYAGIKMHNSNYALVSKKKIKVYGLFGQLKKEYTLKVNEKFELKKNRIYVVSINSEIKIKMNNWFVNQNDWQRAIEYFSLNKADKITKHLVDD